MIFEFIAGIVVNFLNFGGYLSLVVLMALESMIFPIPSELVMPFAGFLVSETRFSWFGAVFFSTLGTVIGSLISYYIGLYGGNRFLHRFGKYFLLDENSLIWTEHWFSRHGAKTVFISRFIPIVRHVISIPAGIGRMKLGKFILYTALGGGIWNTFLIYLGVVLKNNWMIVHEYSSVIDYVIIALLIVAVIWIVYGHVKRRKNINQNTLSQKS